MTPAVKSDPVSTGLRYATRLRKTLARDKKPSQLLAKAQELAAQVVALLPLEQRTAKGPR